MTFSILEFFLSTGGRRKIKESALSRIITLMAAAISLYHIGALAFFSPEIFTHRPIHLLSLLALAFLTYSFSDKKVEKIPVMDVILTLLSICIMVYFLSHVERLTLRAPLADPLSIADLSVGILLLLLVFEAVRRVVGFPLVAITFLFLLYAYFGPNLPGVWRHGGMSLPEVIDGMAFALDGIWGIPIAVSASFIILFVIFGQLLLESGGGEFYTDLAKSIMGKWRGGPAKVAVVSSALFGSMSGSAPANVATTGSFTIPMMKQSGFKPHFAGAVEATASTGGLITPPVMAGVLFLMSEITGIPYLSICKAAVIPALLFYTGCFAQIHLEAVKSGLKGLPKEQLPLLGRVLTGGGQFFIPLIVIIWVLLAGYSPIRAALWAMIATILVSMFRKGTRMGVGRILDGLAGGARSSIVVTVGCACGSMIMGIVFQTGLGLKFSSAVITLSGGSFLLALILAMIACLFLGLALSISASYILTYILVVPAVIQMGISPMAAHLFAIYYAVLSVLSPPVGGTFYVAAAIAGAEPMRVGFTAMRLAIAGFIVPFFFVYQPALLMMDTPIRVAMALVTAIIGVVSIAAAVEGCLLKKASLPERVLLFVGGIVLVYPGYLTDITGICLLVVLLALQAREKIRVYFLR